MRSGHKCHKSYFGWVGEGGTLELSRPQGRAPSLRDSASDEGLGGSGRRGMELMEEREENRR